MNIPAELKYTTSHEWVRVEADGNIEIGRASCRERVSLVV